MKIYKYAKLGLVIGSLIFASNVNTQPLNDSITKKLDSLFIQWNNSYSPGCTIGIVQNDSLIYAKGYGLANIEYKIPNTPETIFHMASVSKQFTGYSIVLLAKSGKLKLDDNIRKYLPWFPELGEQITIRHLLNHTSGIRDQWQLLAISGTRLDDVITQEHIVKILGKQQALNFKPGDKFSYSNSGYTMLAEIVRAVTGQTLRKFTDSAIFKPLGMASTHFHDNYTEIETNRAYSYDRTDSTHFTNSLLNYSNAGATSLFTNIPDMSKWVMNFFKHKVGDQSDIDLLVAKSKFNNGKESNYALGISVDKYRGWTQYSHGGGDAGYRTFLSVFPDLKIGIIVFSNAGDFNPNRISDDITNLFVKDTSGATAPKKQKANDSTAAILKKPLLLQKYGGDYISDEGLPLNLEIKDNKLFYTIYNQGGLLTPGVKDTFSIFDQPDIKFVFTTRPKDTVVDIITQGQLYHLKKFSRDTIQSEKALKEYTGKYYSAELDCTYGIELKDGELVLTNAKYNDTKLTLSGNGHLTNGHWWMNHLVVLRDSKNVVNGFEVNSGRIMHLKFTKTQCR